MSELQTIYRCTPRQIRQFMIECFEAGLVPMITSSPGSGKSAITHSINNDLNLQLIDHRLTTSDPTDMSGLPNFDKDGFAYFAPFRELFPLEGTSLPKGKDGWLIFFDEFNSADKRVQAACYKILLDRRVGQHKLHERVVIACAGNLMTDRAIVNPLSTALESRTVQLEMEVSFDQWLEDVALKYNYDTRIIAFLSHYQSLLMDFKSTKKEKSFCCPRTWEFMNRLIEGREVTQTRLPLYAGTITPGVAANFVEHCAIYKDLISVKQILNDPAKCHIPQENALKWGTVAHMTEFVNEETFDGLAEYANRFSLDYRILFYRSVMVRHSDLRHHPAFGKAAVELSRYLNG